MVLKGSGHPKWCHWGGQGAQSGAIGSPKDIPESSERSSGEVKDGKSGPAEAYCLQDLCK